MLKHRGFTLKLIACLAIVAVMVAILAGGATTEIGQPTLVSYAAAGRPQPTVNSIVLLVPAVHRTLHQRPKLPTARPTRTLRFVTSYLVNCQNIQTQCRQALAQQINADRAAVGAPPLTLVAALSSGTAACIGATGHSKHMASVGQISHDQFAADVCASYSTAGENVGEAGYGSKWSSIREIHALMMAEPWTPGCQENHHCNLLFSGYSKVGIGFAVANGGWYLTEIFMG